MDNRDGIGSRSTVEVSKQFDAHSEQLLHGLNELRQQRQLCDVVLRVGDCELYAHKAVLASCSPYFKAMFTCSLAETHKRDVDLQCIDAGALKALLDFAYTGIVSVTQGNVQGLLAAANLLQLKTVAEECCLFLENQLHSSNCIGISRFAEMHACYDLYQKAIDFLLDNFSDVIETEEFLQLSEEELIDIISNDDLVVSSEEKVLNAVDVWIQDDPKARQHCLPNLLKNVRLAFLSVRFLEKCLTSNHFVSNDSNCQQIIKEILQYKTQPELRLWKCRQTTVKTSMTKPRQAAKVLCAVGGKNGLFATLDSVEVYISETDIWTEVEPLSARRFECGSAVLDHHLYVIGGIVCNRGESVSYRHHDTSMEVWSLKTDEWRCAAGMKERRSALGVGVLQGHIYACGGYDGQSYLSSVESYAPKTDTWTSVCSMLQSRSCFCVASLEGALYAVGGYGPPCLNSAERYDPVRDCWEKVASMTEKRINFGMGVACGFLFVVGGHNGAAYLSSTERYDPYSNQWTMVTGMGRPRTGLNVAVLNDKIYAVGGHSGCSYLNRVQCYDPYEDNWSDAHNMSTCRCSFSLAAI